MREKQSLLTNEAAAELHALQEPPPCLSLYQSTHRRHPENQQDPIRFRNLVEELEASLRREYPTAAADQMLEPFHALAADAEFWNHTPDGLAVLSARGFFRVFTLQRPVEELAIAADSFHTKPLRRYLQSVDRYHVLGLSLHEMKLFEGNRDALDPVDLAPGVPRTITEALGDELTEPHQTVASYGGTGAGSSMRHSHGGKKDEMDIDTPRVFRAVDRAVLQHYSKPSGLPLILAALAEHHGFFRQVSQNPHLLAEGITIHPEAVSLDDLRARAWKILEPQYHERLTALGAAFKEARAKDLGSDDLDQVAEAAAAGRVATLLIEADRQIAGRLDGATGKIERKELSNPQVDDLLDDLAEWVGKTSGLVRVLPAEWMPAQTGVAATYRY
ncbi:MAG: hypothetical protein M3Q86_12920 [Verrucomicrobiota bacterium]|nr:hypothetical protein [Verrucomicrobiota bacterium]